MRVRLAHMMRRLAHALDPQPLPPFPARLPDMTGWSRNTQRLKRKQYDMQTARALQMRRLGGATLPREEVR